MTRITIENDEETRIIEFDDGCANEGFVFSWAKPTRGGLHVSNICSCSEQMHDVLVGFLQETKPETEESIDPQKLKKMIDDLKRFGLKGDA